MFKVANYDDVHGLIRSREIGDGRGDSWFMPLTQQVELACAKVKQMEELRQGFNIVGRSQVLEKNQESYFYIINRYSFMDVDE